MRRGRDWFQAPFVFAGLLLLACGCTSINTINDTDVNEDMLYGFYSAKFDARDSALTLFAQFRVGGNTGTTVRLQPPSSLTADGEPMRVVDGDENVLNISGTYYMIEKKGAEGAGAHTFVWTRRDGSTRTNVVKLGDASSISMTPEPPLIRSAPFTVMFPAVDVEEGESVACTLKSAKQEGVPAEEAEVKKSVSRGQECVFAPQDVARLRPGPAAVLVERFRSQDTQQGHESIGGIRSSQAASKELTVTVAP